jgi:ABC-type branched-subunit amino acid transport system substrate-binding protein
VRAAALPCAAFAAVAILVAAGCGGPDPKRELTPGTIFVGVLVDPGLENEELIAAGARVAVEELNNSGGIDGVVRVRLLVKRARSGGYAHAARALLEPRVVAVLLPCGDAAGDVATVVGARAVLLAPCIGDAEPLPAGAFGTGVGADDPSVRGPPIAGSELDEFYERYKSIYGTRPSSSRPALGYDALRVLAVAAKEAGSTRPALVERELVGGLEVGASFGKIRYEHGSRRPRIEVRNVTTRATR